MPTIVELSQNGGPYKINGVIKPSQNLDIREITRPHILSVYCAQDDSKTLIVSPEGHFDSQDVIGHIIISDIRHQIVYILEDGEFLEKHMTIDEHPGSTISLKYTHRVAN